MHFASPPSLDRPVMYVLIARRLGQTKQVDRCSVLEAFETVCRLRDADWTVTVIAALT